MSGCLRRVQNNQGLKRPEDNHGAEDRNIPLHYATVPGCRVKAEINVRPGAGRSTSRDPQRLD